MATYAERVQQARAEGYTDAQIAEFLSKSDPRIQTAVQSGHTIDDVASYLDEKAGANRKDSPTPEHAPFQTDDPYLSGFVSDLLKAYSGALQTYAGLEKAVLKGDPYDLLDGIQTTAQGAVSATGRPVEALFEPVGELTNTIAGGAMAIGKEIGKAIPGSQSRQAAAVAGRVADFGRGAVDAFRGAVPEEAKQMARSFVEGLKKLAVNASQTPVAVEAASALKSGANFVKDAWQNVPPESREAIGRGVEFLGVAAPGIGILPRGAYLKSASGAAAPAAARSVEDIVQDRLKAKGLTSALKEAISRRTQIPREVLEEASSGGLPRLRMAGQRLGSGELDRVRDEIAETITDINTQTRLGNQERVRELQAQLEATQSRYLDLIDAEKAATDAKIAASTQARQDAIAAAQEASARDAAAEQAAIQRAEQAVVPEAIPQASLAGTQLEQTIANARKNIGTRFGEQEAQYVPKRTNLPTGDVARTWSNVHAEARNDVMRGIDNLYKEIGYDPSRGYTATEMFPGTNIPVQESAIRTLEEMRGLADNADSVGKLIAQRRAFRAKVGTESPNGFRYDSRILKDLDKIYGTAIENSLRRIAESRGFTSDMEDFLVDLWRRNNAQYAMAVGALKRVAKGLGIGREGIRQESYFGRVPAIGANALRELKAVASADPEVAPVWEALKSGFKDDLIRNSLNTADGSLNFKALKKNWESKSTLEARDILLDPEDVASINNALAAYEQAVAKGVAREQSLKETEKAITKAWKEQIASVKEKGDEAVSRLKTQAKEETGILAEKSRQTQKLLRGKTFVGGPLVSVQGEVKGSLGSRLANINRRTAAFEETKAQLQLLDELLGKEWTKNLDEMYRARQLGVTPSGSLPLSTGVRTGASLFGPISGALTGGMTGSLTAAKVGSWIGGLSQSPWGAVTAYRLLNLFDALAPTVGRAAVGAGVGAGASALTSESDTPQLAGAGALTGVLFGRQLVEAAKSVPRVVGEARQSFGDAIGQVGRDKLMSVRQQAQEALDRGGIGPKPELNGPRKVTYEILNADKMREELKRSSNASRGSTW